MLTPKEAINKLIEGNKRFVDEKTEHPNINVHARLKIIEEQKPFAVIVSCSDSRVPPQIIFDQGLGDLFIIRNAGHVITEDIIGSIEYAIKYLNVKLVMIMGHNNCGAVEAAINNYNEDNHIKLLSDQIRLSTEKVKGTVPEEELLNASIIQRIKDSVEQLKHQKPLIDGYYDSQKIEIIGSFYDLATGEVKIISD